MPKFEIVFYCQIFLININELKSYKGRETKFLIRKLKGKSKKILRYSI